MTDSAPLRRNFLSGEFSFVASTPKQAEIWDWNRKNPADTMYADHSQFAKIKVEWLIPYLAEESAHGPGASLTVRVSNPRRLTDVNVTGSFDGSADDLRSLFLDSERIKELKGRILEFLQETPGFDWTDGYVPAK